MKVLQVIGQIGHGGAEILCTRLSAWLGAHGVDTTVLVLQRLGNAVEEQLAAGGARVIFAADSLRSPRGLARLARELRRGRYDLVHAHLFPSLYWVALLRGVAPRRSRFVFTEHSTGSRRRRPAMQPLERRVYTRYDALICISPAAHESLAQWVPQVASRLHTIENGVDLTRFAAAATLPRAALGLGADDLVVAMVGAFRAEKNQAGLIEALALLPPRYRLLLIGDGVTRADCERRAAALGVGDRVVFTGARDDVERLLRSADVYALPSLFEGFGLSCVEAMAAGLPVVASDVEGLREVVGAAGLLCDPRNPADIAAKLRRVCEDAPLRARLAAAGAGIASTYNEAATFEKTLALYRQLAPSA